MTNKKKNNMSLSLDVERQEILENTSKKLRMNKSQLVRDLMDKYLEIFVEGDNVTVVKHVEGESLTVVRYDDSEKPIVLKVPVSILEDSVALKDWLYIKVNAIVAAFEKKSP